MKFIIKKILGYFGLRIVKISKNQNLTDVLNFLFNKLQIKTILDIGANEGQFIKKIRQNGYKEKVISFEPLKDVFNVLKKNSSSDLNWKCENIAIGNKDGETMINESNYSLSSSILPISKEHLQAKENSNYINRYKVVIKKLDTYIKENDLIDDNIFLKINTQGTEFDVLTGVDLNLNKIRGIICELTLTELYVGQKLWVETIKYLEKKNFEIWFLEKGFQNNKNKKILQIDSVFINQNYKKILN